MKEKDKDIAVIVFLEVQGKYCRSFKNEIFCE